MNPEQLKQAALDLGITVDQLLALEALSINLTKLI